MQKIEKTALKDTFFLAHSQGINTIPVKENKTPACGSWSQWQTQPQTLEEAKRHSNGSSAGIAVITGTASGGLEAIDFDQIEAYQEYLDAAQGTPMEAIIGRVREGYEEASPKGIHWLYRISDAGQHFPDNEKWSFKDSKVAIETRSQGGYIVTAPSLDGRYKLLSGSLDKIVTITMAERNLLRALAYQLCKTVHHSNSYYKAEKTQGQAIDQWNSDKTWNELLEPDGYEYLGVNKRGVHEWHFKGSDNRVSAVSGVGGKKATRDTFTSFTTNSPSWMPLGKTLSKFDYVMFRDYQGDFKKAFQGILKILGIPVKNLGIGKKNQASPNGKIPEIDLYGNHIEKPPLLITVDESQVTKDALEILKEDQFLYIKAGRIVSPMIQGKKPKGKDRSKLEGKLSIIGVEVAFIRARLMDQARLYKELFSKKGEVTEEPARCPEWLPSAISATAINGEMNPIRPIEGILAGPVIDQDGSLINNDGYSLVNDYGWYQAGRVDGLKLNEDLSQKGCSDAAHRLLNLLCDFEFQDPDLDPVKWLSCLLSQLCRQLYQNCPLFIFSANIGGAGKTHLAKAIGLICHGTECVDPEWPEAKEKREDEMGKMNAGYAFSGTTLVNYDNVPDGLILASSVFEKQLTSPNIYHRENHKHTEIGGKNWLQWMVTGNNVRPNGFLAIRSLVMTLQSTSANPSSLDPSCFTHGDFLQHIKKNRITILQDALSIIAGYIRAGKPEQSGKHLARFEGWLKIPCSAVRWATGLDPLSDHQRTVADADPTSQALEMLAQGWMEAFPDGPVRASKIFNLVTGGNQDANTENIREAITLLVRSPLKNVNQIGPALHRFKGRVIEIGKDKFKLIIEKDSHSGTSLYSFHRV